MSLGTIEQRYASDVPQELFQGVRHRCCALSVALGMVTGLLPKENLLVVVCLLTILLLPARLVFGLVSLIAFTIISIPFSPIFEALGSFLLDFSSVRSLGSALFTLPLGAWTMLNNTLVLGSFVFGLILFWPVYHAALNGLNLLFPKDAMQPNQKTQAHSSPEADSPLEVEVLYTVPIEYNTPGFFESSGGSGRFNKPSV